MTQDAWLSLLRQILTAVFSSGAIAAFVSSDQAATIISGIVALASVGWSVYAHFNMKKVPATAVVVSAPSK